MRQGVRPPLAEARTRAGPARAPASPRGGRPSAAACRRAVPHRGAWSAPGRRRARGPRSCGGTPCRCRPRRSRPSRPAVMPSPSPSSRSSYTPEEIQVDRVGKATASRSVGVGGPRASWSALRSGPPAGDRSGSLWPSRRPPGPRTPPPCARILSLPLRRSRRDRGPIGSAGSYADARAVADRARPGPHRPRRARTWRGSSCCSRTGRSSPTSRSPTWCSGCPTADGAGYWAAAQMRPTTGPTAYVDDLVGAFVPKGRRPLLDSALRARAGGPGGRPRVARRHPGAGRGDPGARGDRILGVIARNTNLLGVRTPSRLELAYLQTADRPDPDDRARALPVPRPALGPRRLPARGRRVRPDRRGRPGHLRQPQRAVGLPPARALRGPDRAGPRRDHPVPGAGRAAGRTRRRSARCSAARRPATPRSAPTTPC